MKVFKLAAWILAAAIALLLAGVAIALAVFDGEKIRSELVRVMQDEKQRTLVLAAAPKLSVWPDVGIQLSGLTLSERSSPEQFLALVLRERTAQAFNRVFRRIFVSQSANLTGNIGFKIVFELRFCAFPNLTQNQIQTCFKFNFGVLFVSHIFILKYLF